MNLLFFISFASAQTSAPSAAGLDSLSDDRLMAELANRGLTTLLDRAFEVSKVPPDKQQGVRSLIALRELSDPNVKLTPAQRKDRIANIVAGVEQALPSMSDPKMLLTQAEKLIDFGAKREVNTLEYWGENPKTQAALKPVAQTVIKLLDKAAEASQKNADTLANSLSGANDPKIAQLEESQRNLTIAQYAKARVSYYLCLALPANDPERKTIADEAIAFLTPYDAPDFNVQSDVRDRLARLNMAKGDYPKAKAFFDGIATKPQELKPPPGPIQQYEARYFSVVCDVLAKNTDAAAKGLSELVAWQKANLPADKGTQEGVGAAASMLQYRIHNLNFELAKDEETKTKANAAATAVLIDLVKQRPDLQGIIYEQLMAKLPANADLKTLDPLLLAALVRKGDEERVKPATEKIDQPVVERAIAAAKELISRRGQPGVDAQIVENAALLTPFLIERLGRPPEAAQGFLDFVQTYPTSKNAKLALDNAQATIARLRADKATADEPATVAAYDRFFPLAIAAPFNRKEFAYDYARRLQGARKFKEAVALFRQVPADDKRIINARYYELVAQQQRLDQEKLEPAERQQIVADFQKLADDVRTRATTALNAAKVDTEKQQYRLMFARTALLGAEIARREQKDANQTLKMLVGYEDVVKGLPSEKDLLAAALNLRVQAYMGLQKTNEATTTLVTLLKARPGAEGADLVLGLMKKLNDDLDRAREAGDKNQMKVLAKNRAQLSGFLVEWAKTNTDPNIKKFTYRYTVFDASTKQLAAELEEDPAARKASLTASLDLYRKLQSPESVALYQATIDPKTGVDPNYTDPAVTLGVGLVQYNLGNFAEAQKSLGQLLTDRKLGTPTMAIVENGESRIVDNDQYWEATLKLMRSNAALAKGGDAAAQAALDGTKTYLKQLYIQWGPGLGGKKWNGEFEKLRAELIPEFKPEDLAATTEPAAQKQK